MNYLLDTNILLVYLRENKLRAYIEAKYDPFASNNTSIISVVTVGEIKSIGLRNKWGKAKMEKLFTILNNLVIVDINAEDVIDMYAEIDAFSQGKLNHKPLNKSPRNMGKNDLWIAATASVLSATLLTVDKDFRHLNQIYFNIPLIENG